MKELFDYYFVVIHKQLKDSKQRKKVNIKKEKIYPFQKKLKKLQK